MPITKTLGIAITGVLVFCCCGESAANDFNQCDGNSRNITNFYRDLDEIVRNNDYLQETVIGRVSAGKGQYALKSITYRYHENAKTKVFMSGGLHGDEPAAVTAMLEYLKEIDSHLAKYGDISMVLIPLANPSGWINCNRLTRNQLDINREFFRQTGKEVKLIDKYLEDKTFDVMIDHHEDPRDHVKNFYIVTYGNPDIHSLQNALRQVKQRGFGLRKFRRTNGFLTYSSSFMPKLKQKTFMLFERMQLTSKHVYQVETPTSYKYRDRVNLHKLVADVLIEGVAGQ